jgi:hypothetical protein
MTNPQKGGRALQRCKRAPSICSWEVDQVFRSAAKPTLILDCREEQFHGIDWRGGEFNHSWKGSYGNWDWKNLVLLWEVLCLVSESQRV